MTNLADLEDDFLARDPASNLSVEFSESVSFTSTGSSGSTYVIMKQATARQQENLYSNGKAVRAAYLKFNCGQLSANQFREELSNLGIQETGSFLRLLNQNNNSLQYSKFLMSLTHIDEEDLEQLREEFRAPVKATAPSATPFATMDDVMNPPKPEAISTAVGGQSSDVLTWNTPPPQNVTPSRKKEVKTSYQETSLATYEPDEYIPPTAARNGVEEGEKSKPAKLTPQERNALIQAFLGGSVKSKQFKEMLLERAGIESSENLDHIISEHENGKTIKFLDIVKELTVLQEKTNYQKISRPVIANSTTRSTVDIFNMETAPDHLEERVAVPHSKEQLETKRHQTNLFTWENAEDQKVLPSRKLGVGSYAGTNDIFDRTPEKPKVNPAIRSNRQATAEGDSGDIFTWSTPPKKSEESAERHGKRAIPHSAGGGISSIPWGTESDRNSDANPHSHLLTKRT